MDGCAVFLRSPLMATQSHAFRLRDVAQRHFPASLALRTGAGYAAALWREVHEKLTLAVALEVTTQSGRSTRSFGTGGFLKKRLGWN
eukprot:symbB.v1.2.008864.t1/scaffold558.1/size187683/5